MTLPASFVNEKNKGWTVQSKQFQSLFSRALRDFLPAAFDIESGMIHTALVRPQPTQSLFSRDFPTALKQIKFAGSHYLGRFFLPCNNGRGNGVKSG